MQYLGRFARRAVLGLGMLAAGCSSSTEYKGINELPVSSSFDGRPFAVEYSATPSGCTLAISMYADKTTVLIVYDNSDATCSKNVTAAAALLQSAVNQNKSVEFSTDKDGKLKCMIADKIEVCLKN